MPWHVSTACRTRLVAVEMHCVGADLRVCPVMKNGHDSKGAHTGAPLHRIVQWFKTMVTNEYLRGVKRNELLPMPGKLWQRNYYEHIIRNEDELNRIREYIENNPMQWAMDAEHPDCKCVGLAQERPPA